MGRNLDQFDDKSGGQIEATDFFVGYRPGAKGIRGTVTSLVAFIQSSFTTVFAPAAHTHAIGDIPVAASGVSDSTKVARSDDSRLHTHSNKTQLDKIGESAGNPTWNGSAWPGTGSPVLTCAADGSTHGLVIRKIGSTYVLDTEQLS